MGTFHFHKIIFLVLGYFLLLPYLKSLFNVSSPHQTLVISLTVNNSALTFFLLFSAQSAFLLVQLPCPKLKE